MVEVFMTRTVLLRSWMGRKLSRPVLEAGRREQSLLPSYHIRYIEHHQLPDIKGPVYVISILENFSRMLLASAISERQDTAAYLRVLAKALRNYGAPEAIVTDSGGVFYSKRAMAIYEALDIRKERIDPRQSWQNYIEEHFGIMRRLVDYYLNKIPR
jgi:putative transposase